VAGDAGGVERAHQFSACVGLFPRDHTLHFARPALILSRQAKLGETW
jgi:hypothetical protein